LRDEPTKSTPIIPAEGRRRECTAVALLPLAMGMWENFPQTCLSPTRLGRRARCEG
jgi:hypothetical protein